MMANVESELYINSAAIDFYLVEAMDNGRFYANAASALHHNSRVREEQRNQIIPSYVLSSLVSPVL